jgi:exodeoxyribonuclease-1
MHPWNKNAVIVIDLRGDMNELLNYSAEEIKAAMYTATEDLEEGRNRVPLKLIHLNKCPIVAPFGVLRGVEDLHGLDIEAAQDKVSIIMGKLSEIERKATEVFKPTTAPSYSDQPILQRVESMLYDGFFGPEDKKVMEQIPYLSAEDLKSASYQFNDARIAPLLFLYRAKNFPETLSSEEYQEWEKHCDIRREGNLAEQQRIYRENVDKYRDDPEKSQLLEACYSLYFE